jgi:hypothetical protein
MQLLELSLTLALSPGSFMIYSKCLKQAEIQEKNDCYLNLILFVVVVAVNRGIYPRGEYDIC